MKFLVNISLTDNPVSLLTQAHETVSRVSAPLIALYVETKKVTNTDQLKCIDEVVALAKKWNIEFRIISNYDIWRGISDFINKEDITHIIVGKNSSQGLYSLFQFNRLLQKVNRHCSGCNILILNTDSQKLKKTHRSSRFSYPNSDIREYITAVAAVIITAGVCFLLRDIAGGYRVFSFILLFVVSILAFFSGTGPVLVASTLSALIWNFFFIPPHYTLHIDRPEDVMMFIMFFIIALLNGVLTTRLKNQESRIRVREERTYALYQLTRDLSATMDITELKQLVTVSISKYFNIKSLVLLSDDLKNIDDSENFKFNNVEKKLIQDCYEQSVTGGRFTNLSPNHPYSYHPMMGNQIKTGVIILQQTQAFTLGEEQFWEACLSQISAKFERETLRNMARNAYLLNESDKLYKTLFNSISHELRIPVTTILGASDTLITEQYPDEIKTELIREINTASIRLNHVIENLLNMSRLESGHIAIKPDWCDLHDLVNRITDVLKNELSFFLFDAVIPDNFPLVKIDFGIVEQIIHNLLLNATQYSPQGSKITLSFALENETLIISVTDEGPGLKAGEEELLFGKFYRGITSRTGGTGLGLSIVKGFTEAHGGQVQACNNEKAGSQFTVKIPVEISLHNDKA